MDRIGKRKPLRKGVPKRLEVKQGGKKEDLSKIQRWSMGGAITHIIAGNV
jgi:hypothetical protein